MSVNEQVPADSQEVEQKPKPVRRTRKAPAKAAEANVDAGAKAVETVAAEAVPAKAQASAAADDSAAEAPAPARKSRSAASARAARAKKQAEDAVAQDASANKAAVAKTASAAQPAADAADAEDAAQKPAAKTKRTRKPRAKAASTADGVAEGSAKQKVVAADDVKADSAEGVDAGAGKDASESEAAPAKKPVRKPRRTARAKAEATEKKTPSEEGSVASDAAPAAQAEAADNGVAGAAAVAEAADMDGKGGAIVVASADKAIVKAEAPLQPGAEEPAEQASEAGKQDAESAKSGEASTHGRMVRRRVVRTARGRKEAADADKGAESAAQQDSKPGRAERKERAERSNREERQERTKRNDRSDRQERSGREERQERQERNNREERQERADRNRQDRNGRDDRQDRNDHRRQRREHANARGHEPVVPKTNMEDLAKLKVAELREKAAELELDATGLKKAELVERVYEASMRAEGFVEVEGVLDIMQDGFGFLRTKGYLPSENDVYVGLSLIRRNGLRKGDMVRGQTRPKRDNEKYAAIHQVLTVNGKTTEELGKRVRFGDLTPIFPDDCLKMEHGKSAITARVIDLVSPIGKGQRGLIVSPPKAGKTTILKDIAAAITANNPEVHLMCLLVDERPEEVTDMERSIKGEVISSTFDMPTENHIAVSELVIERAKRLVEQGEDVVVLLDSLTRLARAYNLAQPASGRILSGGVDSTALYPPKRFLGAARNIEGGGSLTILASALIETGSKMDEVIFEEFKGTGNMELKLDRQLADRRIFPAIDPVTSGTRKEDLLLDPQEAPLIWAVRRILANMNNTERAMDMLIKSLKQTNNNSEFLLRTAKKAQTSGGANTSQTETFEF